MSYPQNTNNPLNYRIRVQGRLDESWSVWFDGMEIMPQENKETLLVGTIGDQSALHGLLKKIRDLNLTLISLRLTDHTRES